MIYFKSLFMILLLSSKTVFSQVLPIGLRYEGAGALYGALYKKDSGKNSFLVGATGGDIKALGAMYTKHLSKKFELSLALGVAQDINLETTYERGVTDDRGSRYTQELNLTAIALGGRYQLIEDRWRLNFSIVKSTVELGKYENEYRDIQFDQANLFDIETLTSTFSTNIDFYNNAKDLGIGFNLGVSSLSGRKGQSDHLVSHIGINSKVPVTSFLSYSLKGQINQASVSSKKYATEEKIKEALNAQCSTIVDSQKRTDCLELESDLVEYLKAHNNKGTANPIGGAGSLRSFREFRFKAANTAYYSNELKLSLGRLFNAGFTKSGKDIELISFYDVGFANDKTSDLFDKSVYSFGGGVNLKINKASIQLQASRGRFNSNAWSLSVGNSF